MLRPGNAAVGAAENPVEQAHKIHHKAEVVEQPPKLLTDDRTDIKTQRDERPGIETDLAQTNPNGFVLYRAERNQELQQGEIDVFVAQNDEGMEHGES